MSLAARARRGKVQPRRGGDAGDGQWFRSLIAARRAAPRRAPAQRHWSRRDAGERLSDDELVASCLLLLFAVSRDDYAPSCERPAALLRFRRTAGALRDQPGLASAAVEELCCATTAPSARRWRSSGMPACCHGRTLKPGERVFLMMNAANPRPSRLSDPERLDLTRHGVPALTFGYGAICLGFPLARLEGQIRAARSAGALAPHRARGRSAGWLDSMSCAG